MKFRNHIAQDIGFSRAQNIGGKITPTIVVLHDTAGRLTKFNSANYLLSAPSGVSVHFVVERDGTVTQQVPTNRRAGHAGTSEYHGRRGCNNFSIGIEIVNPGRMTDAGQGKARAWYKQTFDIVEHDIWFAQSKEHGTGWWMDYTEEQIDAVEELLVALFAYIPTLEDIVTHWYVSPGRKVDTNPLFPLDSIKARVLGRDDVQGAKADDASDPMEDAGEFVEIDVNGDTLNMRRWPSFNPNVITAIPDGVIVPVIRAGIFADRSWIKVRYGEQEGWVVARYTAPIVHA
ncbi:N-acetylmuramoyl-L-alanine amidase [Sulfitobacter alexandrii]|uniref:1,6-anhydro-N-acetylmuramyl-L-alanine amidase AmpD n=1 Tax=Sulfitobacter alexandrii TaxID=1917485 RepID=A0A1J0WHN6_9RHOB|nr:N-acetylmuramoyl-L-alanine amidase [Sulfitobacter alexandrii]APE43638.1 N-acetylmuramoyl-L-alanine amidase [Sulfitobacter alexandrii]